MARGRTTAFFVDEDNIFPYVYRIEINDSDFWGTSKLIIYLTLKRKTPRKIITFLNKRTADEIQVKWLGGETEAWYEDDGTNQIGDLVPVERTGELSGIFKIYPGKKVSYGLHCYDLYAGENIRRRMRRIPKGWKKYWSND